MTPSFTTGFVRKFTGSTVYYTFTITNIGLVNDIFDLTGLWVQDPNTVAMNIVFQATQGGAAITSTPSIPPNGTYTFYVELSVQGNSPNILNHTQITATSRLCQSSNILSDIYTYEYNGNNPPSASNAQLEIAKTASVATTTVGTSFTYTITLVNNSNSTDATNVLISDQVPAALTITNAAGGLLSGNTISWPIGTLAKRAAVQKVITVYVPDCNSIPSITNTANVSSSPDNGAGIYQASVTVTVTDNIKPVANCKPATIYIDATGVATLTAAMINNGSSDNCPSSNLIYSLSKSSFNCSNIGPNTVTLTVADVSGNASSCTTTVTVDYGTSVGTWLGTVNSDWFNCGNWSGAVIPNASTDVIIPAGATWYPTINASTGSVKNITIAANASVIVNGTGILQIAGTITNSGTFNVSAGTIEMKGSGQTIPASAFQGNSIQNLIISNTTSTSVNLGGPLDLSEHFHLDLYRAIHLLPMENLTLKSQQVAQQG
jgi:uncharacterized repeat protein (TIGR01451 family)